MVQVEGVQKRGRKSTEQRSDNKKERVDVVAWKGYINVSLTEAQKRAYAAWVNDPDLFENALVLALRDGYKLSVDFQVRENAYRASFYCQNPDLPEAGYCLSIFTAEYGLSLHKLVYIHSNVLRCDWSKHLKRSLVDDSW